MVIANQFRTSGHHAQWSGISLDGKYYGAKFSYLLQASVNLLKTMTDRRIYPL
jgi:hypothetical protein